MIVTLITDIVACIGWILTCQQQPPLSEQQEASRKLSSHWPNRRIVCLRCQGHLGLDDLFFFFFGP